MTGVVVVWSSTEREGGREEREVMRSGDERGFVE
jgi:hypothetical protein